MMNVTSCSNLGINAIRTAARYTLSCTKSNPTVSSCLKRISGLKAIFQDQRQKLLLQGCENGSLTLVKCALAAGADVNAHVQSGHFSGCTPLHIACVKGHSDIASTLLDRGANIDATLNAHFDGYTPLHAACEAGHADVVSVLIGRGANIEASVVEEDHPGVYLTPLYYTYLDAHADAARILKEAGANICSVVSVLKRYNDEAMIEGFFLFLGLSEIEITWITSSHPSPQRQASARYMKSSSPSLRSE